MRADEVADFCKDIVPMINKSVTADYINQVRYERLMAKARYFREREGNEAHTSLCESSPATLGERMIADKYMWQCQRIAEALEARAKRIKAEYLG